MAIDPPPLADDAGLLQQVREKLLTRPRHERHWAALAAAAFFAACALLFAAAAVLAPPIARDPAFKTGVR